MLAIRMKHIVSGLAFLAVFVLGAAFGVFGASRVFMRGLEPNMYTDFETAFCAWRMRTVRPSPRKLS